MTRADDARLAEHEAEQIALEGEQPCCRPTGYSGAGWVLVHSPTCLRSPDVPLTPDEMATWREAVRKDRDVKAAVDAHPSSAEGVSPYTIWMTHPFGCDCEPCSYVNEHMDDGR